LFCRTSIRECTKTKEVLQVYESVSGQAINFQKLEIFYDKNTSEVYREVIKSLLQVPPNMGNGKYLGMSSMIGRNKKAMFSYLRDKAWRKIQQWSASTY